MKHTTKVVKVQGSSSRYWKWGDYGDILVHGMTGHLGRNKSGNLQLERAGPYVPPVSCPGDSIVLTEDARASLRRWIPSLTFRKVVNARIVRIDWHLWDTTLDEPPIYPAEGEPEGYILEREHSEATAKEVGQLWELAPEIDAEIQVPRSVKINLTRYSGQHYIRPALLGGCSFMSAELAVALSQIAGEWVSFEPAKV